jgi:hypothetical protein
MAWKTGIKFNLTSHKIIMKTLLLLILLFCASCQKDEHDFVITQIVNLRTQNQIATDCPGFTLTLDVVYNNISYDQRQAIIKRLTFTRWVIPNDTTWVLRHYMNSNNQVFNIFYVYEDSVLYQSYVKSALPVYCPKY